MKKLLLFTLSVCITASCFAQEKFWKAESERSVLNIKGNGARTIVPQLYRTFSLAFDQYKQFLNTAPAELSGSLKNGLVISLPYPDGSFKKFSIVETKMMEDELARQFPQIKTYIGQGLDDLTASIRLDYTSQGFHAFVLSAAGSLFIDPYQKANNDLYITYFSSDYLNSAKERVACKTYDPFNRELSSSTSAPLAGTCIGTELRTYKTAISCTGEYAVAVCPAGNVTVANTLSAILTTMNRVNGVYQTELDIKMILIGAEASVIFTNANNDPYTGNSNTNILINESQFVIDSLIGAGNYDIGHTFSTGEGGQSAVEAVCNNGEKGRGVTGLADPKGDKYDIDFVSHEMGHQFGAQHTFESITGNCAPPNRYQASAYEPGSGTTIMAYAGICGLDNIQLNSDPYFHTRSFDEIVEYTVAGNGGTCPAITHTGNNPPDIIMPVSSIKIPKGTPFTLNGTATDADGDALTYSWEEWDKSNSVTGSPWDSGANSTTRPLFKTRIPKASGIRTFPDMAVILANYPSDPPETTGGLKGETLPQVARDIKFRLVARDNRATGGGVATGGSGCSSTALFKVSVTDDGPFKITSPNTAVTWVGGSARNITWDVANTNDVAGINSENVDILMSTDGGYTYPDTIVLDVPNTGSKSITVPNIPTTSSVRFMVKSSGSIFFDITDANSTIIFNAALPISLLQFSANASGSAILLKWSTATESNNKGFNVLRSEGNNNNFIQIGFISGAGNSSTIHHYSLTDYAVKRGTVYFYRLQQIDINNTTTYSDIKIAKLGLLEKFMASVQPQPFSNTASLYLDGLKKISFTIITSDVTGRVIETKNIKNSEESRIIPVDFDYRASGVYFIKILQDNIAATVKAVKQ